MLVALKLEAKSAYNLLATSLFAQRRQVCESVFG